MLHCYWICWCIFLCLFTPSIDLYSSLVSKLSVLFRLSIIKMWKQRSATGRIQNLLLLSQFSKRKADACDLVVNVSWNYFSGQFPSGQTCSDTPPPRDNSTQGSSYQGQSHQQFPPTTSTKEIQNREGSCVSGNCHVLELPWRNCLGKDLSRWDCLKLKTVLGRFFFGGGGELSL